MPLANLILSTYAARKLTLRQACMFSSLFSRGVSGPSLLSSLWARDLINDTPPKLSLLLGTQDWGGIPAIYHGSVGKNECLLWMLRSSGTWFISQAFIRHLLCALHSAGHRELKRSKSVKYGQSHSSPETDTTQWNDNDRTIYTQRCKAVMETGQTAVMATPKVIGIAGPEGCPSWIRMCPLYLRTDRKCLKYSTGDTPGSWEDKVGWWERAEDCLRGGCGFGARAKTRCVCLFSHSVVSNCVPAGL